MNGDKGPISHDTHARIEAEDGQRKLSYLYRATSTLFGEPLDFTRRLAVLSRLLVPDLGDWCWIDLVAPLPAGRAVTYHWDATKLAHVSAGPIGDGADERRELRIPLSDSSGVIGTITLRYVESNRQYRADDQDLAREMVAQAAWALDAALQYERAKRATTAREDILAVVAHDLRSPLSTVLMASELLCDSKLDDQQLQLVQRTERAATRMEKLVQDLLDWAAIEAGHLRVDVSAVGLTSLLEGLSDQVAGGKVTPVVVDVATTAAMLRCDFARTLQVFSNLVGNAVKFARPGTTVRVSCVLEAEAVRFSIEDRGPGIAPAHLEHIFERYWQVEGGPAQRRGVGLGLAIAKGIVEAQGGVLAVHSVVGEGSTFTFTVPRSTR